MDKLPVPLHGVGACRLRYAVHCGTLFVFEVRRGFRVSSAQESTADFLGIPAH